MAAGLIRTAARTAVGLFPAGTAAHCRVAGHTDPGPPRVAARMLAARPLSAARTDAGHCPVAPPRTAATVAAVRYRVAVRMAVRRSLVVRTGAARRLSAARTDAGRYLTAAMATAPPFPAAVRVPAAHRLADPGCRELSGWWGPRPVAPRSQGWSLRFRAPPTTDHCRLPRPVLPRPPPPRPSSGSHSGRSTPQSNGEPPLPSTRNRRNTTRSAREVITRVQVLTGSARFSPLVRLR